MMLAPQPELTTRSRPYSSGVRGVRQTLAVMRRYVNEGRRSPVIRQAATSIVHLTPEKDEPAELLKIFAFVQGCIRYTGDIHDVETLSTAEKTLLGRLGDCDDKSVLLAALFEAVGYPTRFVVAGYSTPGVLEHVYLQVCLDDGWIDCDSTEPYAMGWAPPDPVTIYFESV